MAVTLTTSYQRIGKDEHTFTYGSSTINLILRTHAYYEKRSNTVARIHFKLTIENTSTITWVGTNKQYTCTLDGRGDINVNWSNQITAQGGQITIYEDYFDLSPNTSYNLSGGFYIPVASASWNVSDSVKTPAFTVAPTTPTVSITSNKYNEIIASYGTTSFGNPTTGTVYLYGDTTASPTTQIASKTTVGLSEFTWENLTGNTQYYIRSRASNSALNSNYSTDVPVITPCPVPVDLDVDSETYTAYNKLLTEYALEIDSDGGAATRNAYYQLSSDDGETWGEWTLIGEISNTTSTFTVNDVPTASDIKIRVKLNNGTDSDYIEHSYTSLATHIAPNFSNFTYQDTNSDTIALTGDNQTMIQGQSIPEITISVANKATGNDGIDVSNYAFNFSGRSDTALYSSSSDVVKTLGTPLNAGSQALSVAAVDLLSLSKAVVKDITVYPWVAPTITSSIARTNGFESESTLKISGTWAPITINSVDTNSLTVSWRYKKQSESTWSNWDTRPVTTNGTDWTTTDLVVSLDNNYQYAIETKVEDAFDSASQALSLAIGMPIFFIGQDGRCSIGQKPSKYLLQGEKGILEVQGRIFSNGVEVGTDEHMVLWDDPSTQVPVTPYVNTADITDNAVTASKIDFSTMPGNYSLSEIDTGYTWIDGSRIYKKTISISSMPNATYAQYAHNITGIAQVIDASFIMANSANTNFWVCPYTSVNLLEITPTMMNVQSSLDLRTYSAYITLYYTKTS